MKQSVLYSEIYILATPPPKKRKGEFLSKLKNREEFEGGLYEKRKGKGGKRRKKKRVKKHMLKYLYEALMTEKKSTKTGKNFRGGGNFSRWPEYIPL